LYDIKQLQNINIEHQISRDEDVILMRKGKLIYETPTDSIFRKMLSLLVITFGFITAIIIQHIPLGILAIMASIIMGTEPTKRYPIIHKKVKVYRNGITRPSPAFFSLFFPSREGKFIPFKKIRAFERSPLEHRYIFYLFTGGPKIIANVQFTDPRNGVLKPLYQILTSNNIPEVDYSCPRCGKSEFYVSETCYKCGFNRFESIDYDDDEYPCIYCDSQLDYIEEYDRWYCSSCEKYN